jgi:hypothetical protein
MTSAVQSSYASTYPNTWELAKRLTSTEKAPERLLHRLFENEVRTLETRTKKPFDPSTKEKIWVAISAENLPSMREFFLHEVCTQVLAGFSEEEARKMLEEHRSTGAVKERVFCLRLENSFACTHDSVIDALSKKVDSIAKEIMPKIEEMVLAEGSFQ